MPSITITELDQTTPGSVIDSTDVVFIPGFVDIAQESLKSNDGAYVGIEANSPQLFTSLSAFEAACGTNAPVFTKDQLYPTRFATNAIPPSANNVFIKAGTADPSYVMAKELIAAGLPVLYQRINETGDAVKVEYNLVSQQDAASLKGNMPTSADPEYFYKETYKDETGKDVVNYLSYKGTVSYPNFEDFVTETGDPNVFEIKPLDYAQVVECYNDALKPEGDREGFFVFDGEIVTKAQLDEMGESSYNVTFKDCLLIETSTGVYEYMNAQLDAPESLPEEHDGTGYALAINHSVRPIDWTTAYFNYYESAPTSEGAATMKYTKIAPIAGALKNYEEGNIFTKVDATDYSIDVNKMYTALAKIFSISDDVDSDVSGLIDRGNHNVKYLTTGGYPVFEYGKTESGATNSALANAMLKLAKHRGDCVALIDHTDYPTRKLNPANDASLYKAVENEKGTALDAGEFGAMFTPWAEYSRTTVDTVIRNGKTDVVSEDTFRAPGSFAYLAALADSIKTNANWLAVAGVARGGVKNLAEMTTVIPNGVADKVQPRNNISINAITNIKPYGYTIWGNRTLKDNASAKNLVATSFLNIRNLVSDIKKTCYRTARKLTFEQDTDVLWINFKSEISKLLDQMKSGYGISGYKIVRDNTHKNANDKATLCAKVVIYPVEAVEDFYITIVLKDDEVSVN